MGTGAGTHWIGGCVVPRVGLDAVQKRRIFLALPGIEPWPSSSSLYRLSYRTFLLDPDNFLDVSFF
jgi:hypothetical protein